MESIRQIIPGFDPSAIAASGQCFRMRETSPGVVDVVAFGRHLRIESLGREAFLLSCDEMEFQKIWASYFDLDTDYNYIMRLCDAEDLCLSAAVAYGRGLRILRQDPWEALVSFIISQRKNIPAIQMAVEKLCRAFGERREDAFGIWYAFPAPDAIVSAPEELLSSCRLGYREKYVAAAALAARTGRLDIARMAQLDDERLYKELITIYGVGAKVANCVMLFGFHRLAVCPVDVWIGRIMDDVYHGDPPFGKYPGYAGVIQQYLFHYRHHIKDLGG